MLLLLLLLLLLSFISVALPYTQNGYCYLPCVKDACVCCTSVSMVGWRSYCWVYCHDHTVSRLYCWVYCHDHTVKVILLGVLP